MHLTMFERIVKTVANEVMFGCGASRGQDPRAHVISKRACASIAQLVEHALRKRTVVGSIPTGGLLQTT